MRSIVTVLVTGCGGAIGMGVIKALRMGSRDLNLIGIDNDSYVSSFYLKSEQFFLNKTYVVPYANDPNYIPRIVEICRNESVNVIFPCTDSEIEQLSTVIDEITKFGVKVIICPSETIKICRDKWLTYDRLSRYLPMVTSALPEIGIEKALQITGLPAIIKPRNGWGSRQVFEINSVDEARVLLGRIRFPIIQKHIAGVEYTVDCLADRKGKVVCVVPRQRIKILGGLSFQGITVKDEDLFELGKRIAEHLRFSGPFNFQVFKNDEEMRITEINPRFSGTGILSVMAGANIPYVAMREVLDMEVPSHIDFQDGLMLSRYFGETYIDRKRDPNAS